MDENKNQIYLGDGAYADFDGSDFTVWTERSDGKHYVVLSGEMIESLRQFKQRAYGQQEE